MRRVLALLICLLPGLAFGQQIPQLPAASTPLSGNEVTVVVQNGITKQTNVASIAGNATLPSAPGNTLLGNSTGSATTAFPIAMPSCNSSANGLTWTLGSGFGCNTFSPSGNVSGPVTTTVGYIPTWANTGGTLLNNGVLASTTINGTVCPVGGACAVSTTGTPQIIVGSTQIIGGTSGNIVYDNAGAVGEKGITGTGNVVLATSPTLASPALGTPSSAVLTNATGLPISTGLAGAGTGALTALGINIGTAGAIVVNGGSLGAPSSGSAANLTGLPISGLSGLGTGVATALGNAVNGTGGLTTFGTDLPLAGGTMTGALTGADGGVWSSSGLVATTMTASSTTSSPAGLFGGTTSTNTGPASNQTGLLQLNATGSSPAAWANGAMFLNNWAASSSVGGYVCTKSRGSTVGTNIAVQTSDSLCQMLARGADGTNYPNSSQILMQVDPNGTVSTGFVPGLIAFKTTSNSGALVQAAEINYLQHLLIGTATDSGNGQLLQVAGSGLISGNLTLGASPIVSTTSGILTLSPAIAEVDISGSTPAYELTDTAQGTNLKNWLTFSGAGNYVIQANNDANSAGTAAYQITRGTTYNVAQHTWFTSTTPGTPIQAASLGSANFQVGTVTATSFVAVQPGANAWVNFIQVSGGLTTQAPVLYFAGTDTNVASFISTKGAGEQFFTTRHDTADKVQFAIIDNTSGADYVTVTSGASAGAINTNAGNLTVGSAGGTTTHSDVNQDMPNIASSASALDAVCWNATGGVLTHNSAGALCSASLEELKDMLGDITAADADADLMVLHPFWGKFKDSVTSISDHRVQPFFGAHQVESVDPRLVEYDDKGNLRSVRYANITALLTAAYQQQKHEIANLEARMSAIEAADRRQTLNSVN